MNHSRKFHLQDTVVDGGFCVGCGACAAVQNSPLAMKLDSIGRLQPYHIGSNKSQESAANDVLEKVCPFSSSADSEDLIAKRLFGHHPDVERHSEIGYYIQSYVGYAIEEPFRSCGSSGGLLNWTAAELLRQELVDHVIHVRPRTRGYGGDLLFEYCVSSDLNSLLERSKSRYYPVEMSHVIERVRQKGGRYAFVGLPCFVKAVRLLIRQEPSLERNIQYCLSLFCGHLKTTRFADFLAWQIGVPPNRLSAIDFRLKYPDRGASDYGVKVTTEDDDHQTRQLDGRVNAMYGTDWGLGFFKYQACDYCDDVVGETADASYGDAWLPGYNSDPAGTNLIVIRDPNLLDLFERAASHGRIAIDKISPNLVAKSQAGGFRHRRDGLSYRLHLRDIAGQWRPPKRVEPRRFVFHPVFRKVISLRIALVERSHSGFSAALKAGSLDRFVAEVDPIVRKYSRMRLVGLRKRLRRAREQITGTLRRFLKKF